MNNELMTGLRAILQRIDDEGRSCHLRQDFSGYRAHRRDADMLRVLIRQNEKQKQGVAA